MHFEELRPTRIVDTTTPGTIPSASTALELSFPPPPSLVQKGVTTEVHSSSSFQVTHVSRLPAAARRINLAAETKPTQDVEAVSKPGKSKRPSRRSVVAKLRATMQNGRSYLDTDQYCSPAASPTGQMSREYPTNGDLKSAGESSNEQDENLSSHPSLGFRSDLNAADQQQRVEAFHSDRRQQQQAGDHVDCTMDWCSSARGFKWRLKVMIVEAAIQQKIRHQKNAARTEDTIAGVSTAPRIPVRLIFEDIDAFFSKSHVKKLGGAEKAFESIKKQFALMDLYQSDIKINVKN